MSALDYDPTRIALYSPERRDTLFVSGCIYSDLQLAIETARLAYVRAEASTTEMQRLTDALARVGFEAPVLFRDGQTNSQAFGAFRASDRTALVAFRGTQSDSIDDMITDLKADFVEWHEAGGRVHRGFAAAFRCIRPQVDQWLSTEGNDRARLVLTGHSLGGALATLAATIWRPASLFTLGSPRVGDVDFVATFATHHGIRLVGCCDLVTDVPPALGGFRHVAAPTFITRNGHVVENPTAAFIVTDRLKADVDYLKRHSWRVAENVLVRGLADHAPINYARAFFR